jgi:hypothetical protein
VSVPARRRQVACGRERGLSVRRACTLFSVARSALRYQSRKTVKDAGVIERMQELSAQYPRYGYRRIRIFLGRDGARPACSCRARGHASAWQQHGRARKRRRDRTRCGRMTLYSTIVPTAPSLVSWTPTNSRRPSKAASHAQMRRTSCSKRAQTKCAQRPLQECRSSPAAFDPPLRFHPLRSCRRTFLGS